MIHRNLRHFAISDSPSSPGFQTLTSLDVPVGMLSQTRDAKTDCQQCRYPCHLSGRMACSASEYLEMWAEDAATKPADFDVEHTVPLSGDAEVGVVSLGGRMGPRWKPCNQDTFFVHSFTPPSAEESEDTAYAPFVLGVFDGHGRLGKEVSHGVRNAIATHLTSEAAASLPGPLDTVTSHEDWLTAGFAHAAATVDSMDSDFSKSGAAAVICLVHGSRVTAAWAGDCRAVLGVHAAGGDTGKGRSTSAVRTALSLTRDHKPDPFLCPSEAERILACGGRVERVATDHHGTPVGPFRVFRHDSWSPGLALSRAFGDTLARPVGVVSTPDVNSLVLPSTAWANGQNYRSKRSSSPTARHVLIVASDGLWDWMSSETATALAWNMPSAQSAAQLLAEVARKEWAVAYRGRTCDDITVAVAFLPA